MELLQKFEHDCKFDCLTVLRTVLTGLYRGICYQLSLNYATHPIFTIREKNRSLGAIIFQMAMVKGLKIGGLGENCQLPNEIPRQ